MERKDTPFTVETVRCFNCRNRTGLNAARVVERGSSPAPAAPTVRRPCRAPEETSMSSAERIAAVSLPRVRRSALRSYHCHGLRIDLVREPGVSLSQRASVRCPSDALPIFAAYIGEADREQFVVALLTVRHRVIGINTVSVGCLTSSLVHPRETFKPAILAGAAAVILAHNHPSGDPEPSAEDAALTRRLAAAGTLLGIEVLDHLVLGEHGRFTSLKDRGLF